MRSECQPSLILVCALLFLALAVLPGVAKADTCVANVEHITFPTIVNDRISNFTLSLFEPILECVDVVVDNRTLATAGATTMAMWAFNAGNVLSDSLVVTEMDNGPNGDAALNICFWSDDDGRGTNMGSMCDPPPGVNPMRVPGETLTTGPMTDMPTKTPWSATLFSVPLPTTGLPPECPATNPVSDCALIVSPTPEPNTLWTLAVVLGVGVIARRRNRPERKSVALRTIVLCTATLSSAIVPGPHSTARAQSAPVYRNSNDVFAEIGRRAPDFGGMFVDEGKDTLYVYRAALVPGSVDNRNQAIRPSSAEDLNQAIIDVLGPARPVRSRFEVLEGRYTFVQLREWHDNMSPLVLAVPGAVSTDVNHAANRIRVGVETLVIEPNIAAVLAQLGIPREAVNIVNVPPLKEDARAEADAENPDSAINEPDDDLVGRDAQPAAADVCSGNPCTLRSRIRPLLGGIRIMKDKPAPGKTGNCTLGFIARMTPTAPLGLVTNSHCTNIRGGVEGTVFYQPGLVPGMPNRNKIATEAVDPCYWLGDAFPPVSPPGNCVKDGMVKPPNKQPPPLFCPPSIPCRLSDSSFSVMVEGVPFQNGLGFIAKPDKLNPNNCLTLPAGCSVVWTMGAAKFGITMEDLVVQGDTVNKVGQRTGWTAGPVDIVCGNFQDAGAVRICQNRASYLSAPGDSGSPVFKIPNPLGNCDPMVMAGVCNVTLVGIHWERFGGGAVFSPIGSSDPTVSGVQNAAHELGRLFKCTTGVC